MSWYQATLYLDRPQNRFGSEVPFIFFDVRVLRELHAALWAQGCIEVERASAEGRFETRGMAILRDPHVVAIEMRLDLDLKAPNGPSPFVTRARVVGSKHAVGA
ncbi:hypothetical protein ABIB57_004439 [Devosia sp. UYZn731]|uniref:hypothetical protein n=1 Tax=Devosia sp. UYZn731 TaxID=3156345 RepID=UPI00339963AE